VRRTLVLALASGLAAVGLAAQSPQPLTFEVASVRATQPGATSAPLRREPGGFSASNQPLRTLIALAYQVQALQIVGAPDWVSTEPWDILARTSSPIPAARPGEVPDDLLMLRALLEDRFRLLARRELREMPIYALVVARNDRGLGPRIRRPPDKYCEQLRNGGRTPEAPSPPRERECGLRGDGLGSTNATFRAGSVPLTDFARTLAGQVQRMVIDRTGLTGDWDFDLQFLPARFALNAATLESPSIFTALQEQLGLKLDAQKDPVDTLFIDRVEHPVEN